MSDEHPAARLFDQISHTESMFGFLTGALVGLAVGVAVVAATVATGGAALAVVAAVGTGLAATGGGALLGEALGETYTAPTGTLTAVGSLNIFINSIPAMRAMADSGVCSMENGAPTLIAQGSTNVFFNSLNAARKTDKMSCGAEISSGSPNVFIGGGAETLMDISPEVPEWMNTLATGMVVVGSAMALGAGALAAYAAGSVCGLIAFGGEVLGSFVGGAVGAGLGGIIGEALGGRRGRIIGEAIGGFIGGMIGGGIGRRRASGHPVDVASGELFTEVTDFQIDGPIPFVWSRIWMSSSTLGPHNGGQLGWRWHHSYDMALYRWDESGGYVARLGDGRLALFTRTVPGRPSINAVEQLVLETDGRSFWIADYGGLTYGFGDLDQETNLRYLETVSDRNGNSIVLNRAARGRLINVRDSAGRSYAVETDESGRIRSIAGPHPTEPDKTQRLVTYVFDGEGNLISSQDARGGERSYRYDNHLMVMERQRAGLTYFFVWDDVTRGAQARCVDTWGESANGEYRGLHRARFAYDTERGITQFVNGEGATTICRWNDLNLVVEERQPLGGIVRTSYDRAGRAISVEQPDGARSETTYDALGRLTSRSEPGVPSEQLAYAADVPGTVPLGRLASLRDPIGHLQSFTYDDRGNLAVSVDPSGAASRIIRDARGLPLAVLDRDGSAWRWQWSTSGELLAEGPERAARTRYQYDGLGRLTSIQDGEDAPISFVRDENDNIIRIDRSDGSSTLLEYDAEDRVTALRDPHGRVTRWRYGGLDYPLERTTADGRVWLYKYNTELALVELRNPKGETYQLQYDLNGQLICERGFDAKEVRYGFDLSGKLIETWDAGRPTRYRRDAAGRIVTKIFADGTVHNLHWDEVGRLVHADCPDRALDFTYDAMGRIIEERQDAHVLRHQYDARGRISRTTLPDGRIVAVTYGSDDLFASIEFDHRTVAQFRHDSAGRESERRSGGLLQNQRFDLQGQLIHQSGTGFGGAAVYRRDYSYDRSGGLISVDDSIRGVVKYRYDACERLISTSGWSEQNFVFDPADNMVSSSVHDFTRGPEATGDRLLVHGDRVFDYDEHGNRIRERRGAGGAIRLDYQYDAANQLKAIVERRRGSTRITRFGYDPLGRRIWKESEDLTTAANDNPASSKRRRTEFLWNGDVLLSESDQADDPLATVYLFEPMSFWPLAQVRRTSATAPSETYHYHLDRIGTPQEVTNDNGAVVWAAAYQAWGGLARTIVAEVPQPIRFQGQYLDAETQLIYNTLRYYDPDIGRFISQDPIGLAGGLNLYQYAPDPLSWIDPWGCACIKNKEESLVREARAKTRLERRYGKSNVLSERYLRDAKGKSVKDPLTGERRRVDFVVKKPDGKWHPVEVTSPKAPKSVQLDKEVRIRDAGGEFVRNPNTGEIVPVSGISTLLRIK